jgi:hypothetical protein
MSCSWAARAAIAAGVAVSGDRLAAEGWLVEANQLLAGIALVQHFLVGVTTEQECCVAVTASGHEGSYTNIIPRRRLLTTDILAVRLREGEVRLLLHSKDLDSEPLA